MAENKDKKFDKRTMSINMADGIIGKAECEEHLANLPDVADKAEQAPFPDPKVMKKQKGSKRSHKEIS